MPIRIRVTGLENFTEKARDALQTFVETPVPLGKTVLLTAVVVTAVELVVLRKMKFTLILTRKY